MGARQSRQPPQMPVTLVHVLRSRRPYEPWHDPTMDHYRPYRTVTGDTELPDTRLLLRESSLDLDGLLRQMRKRSMAPPGWL